MSKNTLGGTYENLANYIFPRGCECPDDSGSCDWCHVYYGWFDREQMFALGMEKAALLCERGIKGDVKTSFAAAFAKQIRDESWGQTKQSFGKSIQSSKLQALAEQLKKVLDALYLAEDLGATCSVCRPHYENRHEEGCPILALRWLISSVGGGCPGGGKERTWLRNGLSGLKRPKDS